jgi:hypothetical protein
VQVSDVRVDELLARKVICWFQGSVALQWLRGLGQLG